jgi:hypothetical protein
MELEFVDELPGSAQGRYNDKYQELAKALIANPKRWAGVAGGQLGGASPHAAAQVIRDGKAAAFRPFGEFEASVRGGQLFARYVGEG